MTNLLVHSFYPNLVKDTTAPASEGAEPDAQELRAVRQPIQAIQQPLNKLTDDAIIQVHQEKTELLSLEMREEEKVFNNLLCIARWFCDKDNPTFKLIWIVKVNNWKFTQQFTGERCLQFYLRLKCFLVFILSRLVDKKTKEKNNFFLDGDKNETSAPI